MVRYIVLVIYYIVNPSSSLIMSVFDNFLDLSLLYFVLEIPNFLFRLASLNNHFSYSLVEKGSSVKVDITYFISCLFL
jgi:hypothetical protein